MHGSAQQLLRRWFLAFFAFMNLSIEYYIAVFTAEQLLRRWFLSMFCNQNQQNHDFSSWKYLQESSGTTWHAIMRSRSSVRTSQVTFEFDFSNFYLFSLFPKKFLFLTLLSPVQLTLSHLRSPPTRLGQKIKKQTKNGIIAQVSALRTIKLGHYLNCGIHIF